MPLPLTTDARTALNNRNIRLGWFIEIATDTPLYAWNWPVDLDYPKSYVGLGDGLKIDGAIGTTDSLVSESINLSFDRSLSGNAGAFVESLYSQNWHQRSIIIRGVIFRPTAELVFVGYHAQWYGRLDSVIETAAIGQASSLNFTCEGGVFRFRGRNLTNATDADQRRRNPNDSFFRNTALKPFQNIPYGLSWTDVPGGRYET